MEDLNLIYNVPDTSHHRILGIVNDVMFSILSSAIANRHNISGQQQQFVFEKNANLSDDIESCRNLIRDHVTLLEAIRQYKLEKNAKYQQIAKMTLQRIFYKYARIYLIARKGYKDYQHSQRDLQRSAMMEIDDNDVLESMQILNELDINASSDATRHNLNSLESIAILLLEIFGAMFALTIGLWSHLEHYEWITAFP